MPQKRYYFVIFLCIATPFFVWSQTTYRNNLATYIVEIGNDTNKEINTFHLSPPNIIAEPRNLPPELSEDVKYILIWTLPNRDPLMYLLSGSEAFVNRKCSVQNCYITTDVNFMNLTDFDVVLFNGPEVVDKKNPKLPRERSLRQNYVFASIESSDYYPICDKRFNGYFNVSWTYKLNSDVFYGYVIVKNNVGEVIGPKKDMHWMDIEEMKPITETIINKLNSKKKLAAWMVSNCKAPSGRDIFIKKVQHELDKLKANMAVDIYGSCGPHKCPVGKMSECLQMVEQDYYFYFAFENSFSEDYVTEKILHGLQHYSVPVVYGTANYSRFMPGGSYLNAKELGPELLAKKMLEIVNDKEEYYNYFKWINHYSFHYVEETPDTDFYCKFCEAMNDEDLMSRVSVIDNFYEWWNPTVIRRGACPARL